MMTKQELRQLIKARKQEVTIEQKQLWSHDICYRLASHPLIHEAHTVIAFSPLPDEPYIMPLVDMLWREGKEILLPKVTSDTDMQLRLYQGPESLIQGAFGIMEPIGPLSSYDDTSCDADSQGDSQGDGQGDCQDNSYSDSHGNCREHSTVALIPGVAFDTQGHRMGRGRGYYDRYLSSHRMHKIGVCYPFQIVDHVPSEEHDVMVDEVLS